MKYNIGDKVKIRKQLVVGLDYGQEVIVPPMESFCGKDATITKVYDSFYKLDIDGSKWVWTDEMFDEITEVEVPKLIYVCSPYSGDIKNNVEFAKKASRYIVDNGHIPIAPHLLFPQFMDENLERDLAMNMNIRLLEECDEMWIFGDRLTDGMEYELNNAERMSIPVYNKYIDEDLEREIVSRLIGDVDEIDMVNHPKHYTYGKYEVIDVIEDWALPYHLGNVVKYVARAEYKGTKLQDLKKALWYLNRYIDNEVELENSKYTWED